MIGDAWRLIYPGCDLAIGTEASGFPFGPAPSVSQFDMTIDDAELPRSDGQSFGQDYFGGASVVLGVDVLRRTPAEANAAVAQFIRAWRGDAIRSTPGAVAELRSDQGRAAYGRPRRVAVSQLDRHASLLRVTADFATADSVWYADQQSTDVLLVPPATGGVTAPVSEPVATVGSTTRATTLIVGGELPTYPVIEVHGPIVNPVVELVGAGVAFRWEFRRTLLEGQRIVMDSRPWVRSILRNGNGDGGALSQTSTRLAESVLPPGAYSFVLRGISATGLAFARAHVRNASPIH